MRPHFVVPPPCFDDHLCLGAGGEPFEAQALVVELAVKLSVTPFSQAGARSTPCRCRARRSRTPLRGTCSPAARHSRWLAAGEPGSSPVFCATSFITSISSSRSAPASSAAHSWSSCFSRRTSLAPAVDRLFADPVPLGHRQHQLAICLAQDRHYLPFRETRFARCSLRIASQSLT